MIQEKLEAPSTKIEEIMVLENIQGWITPIIQYLTKKKLLDEEIKAWHIKRMSSRYLMVAEQLYKMGRSSPMFRCVAEEEVGPIMK